MTGSKPEAKERTFTNVLAFIANAAVATGSARLP
jgi:hypothetical protein